MQQHTTGLDRAAPAPAPDPLGRHAERVWQIPLAGWRAIGQRTLRDIGRHNLSLLAGGATFFLILAIFPALATFVALYGLVTDPGTVEGQIAALEGLLPTAATELLTEELRRLTAKDEAALGVGVLVSLGLSLWSANAGVKALFSVMNVVYDEEEHRSFVRLTLLSLGFTVAAILGAVLLLGVIAAAPGLLGELGLGPAAEAAISVGRWPLLFFVLVGGIGLLYRYGAARRAPRWRWILWGTLLTALVWVMASALFSVYLANFANYNATYGSLGAVIGFMMWLYVSLLILVAGAELNSEVEHHVVTDTTVGPMQPMGRRGAVMADTVPDEDGDPK